jgi:hypothetical protein
MTPTPSSPSAPFGVFAVQCPKCRKYMLVEETERNKTVACLVCKAPIRAGGPSPRPAGR